MLQVGDGGVQVGPLPQEVGVEVKANHSVVVYYGSKLLIGQVPGMRKDRPGIGMAGKKGATQLLRHVPEAWIRQVGHVHQHAQPLHFADEHPALRRQPPLRLLCIRAGESVDVVPCGVNGPNPHGVGLLQPLQGAVQQLRPLHREEGRPPPRPKGRLRLRASAAKGC